MCVIFVFTRILSTLRDDSDYVGYIFIHLTFSCLR